MRCRLISAGALASVALLATAQPAWADDDEDEMSFEEASIFFELNDTDGDLGIHALVDGEAWKRLGIEDPDGRRMLVAVLAGRLRQQGLTELFFESDEASFDERSPEEFFARFPEGTYEIEGVTLEGDELESEVELTHVLPAPPGNVEVNGESAAEDCDAPDLLSVPLGDVTVDWDPVTESHPDLGEFDPMIQIVGYQFVVEREEPDLLVFSVDLPPDVTEGTVPESFIAPGEEFKFEIVVREASGNQTAVESCFEIE